MRVLVVKDGTVPVAVAEVLYTDVTDVEELHDRAEGGDLELEVFEVEGSPEALDISWADGMGYTVDAITVKDWLKYRQEDECGGPIDEVEPGHYVQSDICHGEDENWYSHLFDLRPVRASQAVARTQA